MFEGEFGGSRFMEMLSKSIVSQQQPGEFSEAFGDDDNSRWIKSEALRCLVDRGSRAHLSWLFKLCRVDLRGGEPARSLERRRFSWPQVVIAFQIVCLIIMSGALWPQYVHDIRETKLKRLTHKYNATRLNPNSTEARELRKAYDLFQLVKNDAHFEWPFIFQCAVLIDLIASIISILILSLILNSESLSWNPLNCVSGSPVDATTWCKLVLSELNHYRVSSLATSHSRYRQLYEDITMIRRGSNQSRGRRTSIQSGDHLDDTLSKFSEQLGFRHHLAMDRLRRIAVSGYLTALNRSHSCQEKLRVISLAIPLYTYSAVVVYYLYGYIHLTPIFEAKGHKLQVTSLLDLIEIFAICSCQQLIIIESVFIVNVLVLTIFDQFVQLKRLETFILYTTKQVDLKLERIKTNILHESSNVQNSALDGVEVSLVTVLLQWRLTYSSSSRNHKLIANIGYYLIAISVIFAGIFFIHCPYQDSDFRSMNMILGLGGALMCTSHVMPVAFIHQVCSKTYKTLWSLVAVLSRHEMVPGMKDQLMLNSATSIAMLRSEVSDPSKSMDKFAYRFFWMPITYANLMKVFFWPLTIFSIVLTGTNEFIPTWILSDPLGLLD